MIDLIFCAILIYCFYRGYSKGLVMAILSLIAYFAGVFCALHFSKQFSEWLHWQSKFAPIISYAILFFSILILCRIIGKMIEKLLEIAQINFINKILGGIIGLLIGLMIISITSWLLFHLHIIQQAQINQSKFLQTLQPLGHVIISSAESFFPIIKNWLSSLINYFEHTK
jgi:membrane protein required for colicin V production